MVSLGLRLRVLLWGLGIGLAGWIGLWLIYMLFQPTQFIGMILDDAIYDLVFRAKLKVMPFHYMPFKKLIVIDLEDSGDKTTRGELARLIDKIACAGAKTIGVDLLLDRKRAPAGDDSLVQISQRYSEKLVLTYRFGGGLSSPNEPALYRHDLFRTLQPIPASWQNFAEDLREYWQDFHEENSVELPFAALFNESSSFGVGHAVYYPDYDGSVRHFPMALKFREGFYPALALEMAKRYIGAKYAMHEAEIELFLQCHDEDSLAIPLDEKGRLLINFVPSAQFNRYQKARWQQPLGDDFAGAIVLIVNSKGMGEDSAPTPLPEAYPKWALHASVISQILKQKFIRFDVEDSWLWGGLFTLLGMLWLVGVEYRIKPARRKLRIILTALNLLYLGFAFVMLCFNIRLFMVIPALVISATYVLTRRRFDALTQPPIYLNIELLVGKAQHEEYPVTVTGSPFGGASGSFKSFLKETAFLDALERIRAGKGTKRDLIYAGSTLFRALFSAQVRSIYDLCWGEARRGNKNFRLQLLVDADELANLPWELLYDEQRREFLALSRKVSITRRFHVTAEPSSLEFRLPLKILAMISSPVELPQLDVKAERQEINKRLRNLIWLRDVGINFTEKATPEELEKHLDAGIQVFHYIGHSAFDSERQEGMLALETEDDMLNWVEGDRLAFLMQMSQVKMVILNSCESAMASDLDVFTGIAQKLINVGIPVVIGMPFLIFDDTAVLFSKAFYRALIRYRSIDQAVAEARRAIMVRKGVDKIDWATPVLFMSNPVVLGFT